MIVGIYTSAGCHACQEAIAYFIQKDVRLHIFDVRNDPDRFAEMLSLGGIATPFITIGDQVFHSFDRSQIDRLLGGRDE